MFSGVVVHGDGIGRTFGFPTANLDIPVQKTHLVDGVYAAIATLQEQEYIAALVVHTARNRIEVFLDGYQGKEFYGSELSVTPLQLVSTYEPISDAGKLHKKITKDVEHIRLYCSQAGYKHLLYASK